MALGRRGFLFWDALSVTPSACQLSQRESQGQNEKLKFTKGAIGVRGYLAGDSLPNSVTSCKHSFFCC